MFTFIQKWHKKIGTYTALFVVFLAISGIALNHSEKFKLNTTFIKIDWLLDLYQINPESEPIGYFSYDNWAVQVGERIYFNNKEIANDVENALQPFHIILKIFSFLLYPYLVAFFVHNH